MSAEYLELEDILTEEKRREAKRKQEDAVIEAESKSAKIKDKEKLIDELMFSEKDSKLKKQKFISSTPTLVYVINVYLNVTWVFFEAIAGLMIIKLDTSKASEGSFIEIEP